MARATRPRRPTRTSSRSSSGRSAPRARPASRRRRSVFWRFRRLFFLAGLVLLAAVAGVGYVLSGVPLPPVDPPLETTFVYDANGNKLAELSAGENRVLVRLEDISPHLVDAVLATEDRDFFGHPGIDASAILRATWADVRGRPLQGGSTITQQYVKSVYTGRERTLLRKLKEATLAVKLERKLPKEEILERYLNVVYFGRGAYGVQAAAKSYFGKGAGELDVGEAAYLAGLIRAPEPADPDTNAAEADRRRSLTLAAMVEEGYLDAAEQERIQAVPVAEWPTLRPRDDVVRDRIIGAEIGTPYFVEYVRSQLAERYGDARLNGGGLQIRTTLDMRLQRAAYEAVFGVLDRPDDPAAALVAIDVDGNIRAMVGGRDFEVSKVNAAVGRAAGGTGRQAGSAFKPFVLADAVRRGFSVESAFDSPARIVFEGAGEGGRDYVIRNYGNDGHGRVNLIQATRVSSNTVYAQLMEELGPESVVDTAHRLGITSEVEPFLSTALGTASVSPLEMASAYLTFATRGERIDPLAVTEVTDSDGGVVDRFSPRRERVLQPEQADVINHVLQGVVERGTGRRADPGRPVAGKTGTTQNNGDAWFVGYSPGLAVAIWMGYPEGQARPMDDVHGISVTGGTLPADIFRRFMQTALDDDRYGGRFEEPGDLGGRLLTRHRVSDSEPEDSDEDDEEDAETTTTVEETTTTSSSTTTSTTSPTTTAPPTTTSSTTTTSSSTTTTKPPPPPP